MTWRILPRPGPGCKPSRRWPPLNPRDRWGHGPAPGERKLCGAGSRSLTRRILHVDCDAFFVQIARLSDPSGAGRAELLLVGGGPSGRGVVTSACYAARAHGVRSGMAVAEALRRCPGAKVAPVSRPEIVERSRRIRAVLEDLAPVVQAASIDEFYLDLTGTERLFARETLADTAWRIREELLRRTEISVSVGGGSNRVLAKLATGRAKPAGVRVLRPEEEHAFVGTLELGEIPGIGPAFLSELARKGLRTVHEAREVQPEWLVRWFGDRRGLWLRRRIEGVDEQEVDPREHRRSISSERTFFDLIDEDDELHDRLAEVVGRVGRTLRRQGLRARTVTVKVRDRRFTTRQHSRTVHDPIESDAAIHDVARALLGALRPAGSAPVRLLGVSLSGLTEAAPATQLRLFDEASGGEGETARNRDGRREGESELERKRSRIADEIRERFGEEALVPGQSLQARAARGMAEKWGVGSREPRGTGATG